MSPDPAQQIDQLRSEIRHHDRKYYVDATPEITDLQYDRLMDRLKQLEAEHPDLVTADSPTQRVGEQPVSHLQQADHRVPMLSIDNTYSMEQLEEYGQRTAELLEGEPIQWVVELKIDGVAASLIYEKGELVRGLTRGNGKSGDDITHNLRTLSDIPLRLTTDHPPDVLEVRGEVYMTNSDLVRLNEHQQAKGEEPYANTRNVAAGSIRLLDPRICAERNLRMFCHGNGLSEGILSDNHMDFLREIGSYGLPPTPHVQAFDRFDQATQHCQQLIERLHELDFEVDGLVLKVNRFDQQKRLGARSKSPRWIIAYKWEKYEATTDLLAIDVQIGKTGAITPVAKLEPVQLAGTTVSRASLHNADEIKRKDVRIGDVVVVEKAGKIIPHIVRVERHQRDQELPEFVFPTQCPACESDLVQDEGGVYIRCPNLECPEQVKQRVRYYATRNAMDIEGLGEKLVDQLVAGGLVKNYGDLYRLTLDQLLQLERMGKRSSEKLLEAIQQSKQQGLARLLNALSIRHVGITVAQTLANHYGSMDRLLEASLEQLAEIRDVGETIAQSLHEFVQGPYGRTTLDDLRSLGLKMESDEPVQSTDHLQGQIFVVTGTLQQYSRDQIHELIQRNGGKTTSSVSKKTDYLVAGENAGSKREKAERLGIKIISEAELAEMLTGPLSE